MPGPTRFRGPALMHALTSNKVSEKTLNERVRKVLELVQLASRAGVPEYAPERKLNRPEDRALLRRAAGESVVLLKNDKNDSTNSPILPLDREKTTLVIGPNADLAAYCGGGSASLLAYYTVTPRQGIADKCGAEQVVFSQGCYGHKELPLLGEHLRTIETGQPGYTFRVYTEPPPASGSFKGSDSQTPVDELHMTNSSAFLMDYSPPQISGDTYYATLEGTFEPPESGVYEFGLTVAGTGLLYIDGVLVVDNKTVQRAGTSFFRDRDGGRTRRALPRGGQETSCLCRVRHGADVEPAAPPRRGLVWAGGPSARWVPEAGYRYSDPAGGAVSRAGGPGRCLCGVERRLGERGL